MQQPADILRENERLRIRLQQVEDIVRAFRGDDVDALLDQHADVEAYRLCNEMLAQLEDAVISVDESDRITYLNAAAERLYGIAASDALGRPQADVFTTPWVPCDDEATAATALRDYGEWRGENVHVGHDGRELSVECRITARKDNKGLPNGRVAVIRDVAERKQVVANLYDEEGYNVIKFNVRDMTERRRVETELRERQNFLNRIFEVLPGVLYIFDLDENRVVFVNNTAALTFSTEEIVGMGADVMPNLMHSDDQKGFEEHTARIRSLSPGETATFEYRMRDKANQWRWYLSTDTVFFRDKSGVARQFIGIALEITDRKCVEFALQESEAKYRTLFEIMQEGFSVLERVDGNPLDYRFLAANPAYERHTKLSNTVGKTMREIVPSVEESTLESYRSVEETGLSQIVVTHVPDIDLWFEVEASSTKQPGQIAVLFRNITERKRAEAILRESQERQAFVLKLSDALRAEPGAEAMTDRALRMLFDEMRLDRCYVGIYRLANDTGEFPHQVQADHLPPLPAQVRLSDFPDALQVASDRTLVIDDLVKMDGLSDGERASFAGLGIGALITATLRKGENNPLWAIVAVSATGRVWKPGEVSLVEEVAERTWAAIGRAQAEAALRDSEERLRTLFDSIDTGFMEVEVEMGPDGRAVDWRYLLLNQAFGRLTGMPDVTGRLASEVAPDLEPEFAERYTQVVLTGEPVHFEQKAAVVGRTFDLRLSRMGGPGSRRVAVVYDDVTARKDSEAAVKESQQLQAFLLKLSDSLRPLSSPTEVQAEACRLLGEQLATSRAYYAENEGGGEAPEIAVVHRDYANGVASVAGRHYWSDYVTAHRWHLVAGHTLRIDNTQTDPAFTDSQRAAWLAISIWACLTVPLVKNGVHVATLAVAHSEPWTWSDGEVALVEEVAERTWAAVERARAEERLQIAHDTFHNLVDQSPFGIYIIDADFRLIQISAGGRKAFANVKPLIGRDFAEVVRAVWPDPFASEVIERFRHTLATGEPYKAITNERRADIEATEAYDWKIERAILPNGRPGVVCHFYDYSEKQQQEDRIKLLMGEVNHRSKNMLGLIQAIARQTVKTQPEDFLEVFGQRVRALSASQDLLVKGEWKAVQLGELVRSQLAHFGDEHDGRITIDGPLVLITASASQSLGMAVHELATNAAKFGALSNESGRVVISWSLQSDVTGQELFAMSWIECGGPPVAKPARRGFGSTVIDGMLRMSLGCDAEVDFAPTGLVWRIGCPAAGLIEGEVGPLSRPNGTAAGKEPSPVSGRRILVVEDESVIAMDFSQTLSEAGYVVIGPANSVARALELLAHFDCDAAVLDVNLGMETSEPVARELINLGTPFVATSGYSREQLPGIMQKAPLLGKPVNLKMLIAEVERCLGKQ